jgi:hypothetical protein
LSALGGFCGSLVLKFDKAQRHQYSTFDVGRSMFDVQSFHCSGKMEFHKKFHIMSLTAKAY